MRQLWIISVMLVLTLKLTAQQDSAYMKVTYRADCTLTHDDKKVLNDQMDLLIGSRSSQFFSRKATIHEHVQDSLVARGYNFAQLMAELKNYPNSMQKYHVFKHFPEASELTFANMLLITRFYYTEPLQIPQWTILPEKREIAGYSCQKAETSFYGRQWEAWFASDIPVQDGPWKLWGLPGLILAAQDSASQYVFTCIGIEKLQKKIVIVMPKKNYKKCTKVQFQELEKLMVEDLEAYTARTMGQSVKGYEADGRPMHRIHKYTPIESSENK